MTIWQWIMASFRRREWQEELAREGGVRGARPANVVGPTCRPLAGHSLSPSNPYDRGVMVMGRGGGIVHYHPSIRVGAPTTYKLTGVNA